MGFSGDNGPPTAASMNLPYGLSVDASGNIYFADSNNMRVREVITSMGLGGLSTSAWTANQPGFSSSITIVGGTTPYTNFSLAGLPPGLGACSAATRSPSAARRTPSARTTT